MDEELVQIGNFLLSKSVLDILIPLISGLFGTILGGLISFSSVRASDNRRWEQEKKDRLSAERREATAMALEWFDPFRDAITKANLMTGTYLQGMIDLDDLRTQWPDLLKHPGLRDPPARLQVWLRPDVYQGALSIVSDLNNFVFNISSFPATSGDEWRKRFEHYSRFFVTAQAFQPDEMTTKGL